MKRTETRRRSCESLMACLSLARVGGGAASIAGRRGLYSIFPKTKFNFSVRAMSTSSQAADNRQPVVFVVGAGDATGGAVARRFAREGFTACVSRRPRHTAELQQLVDSIREAGHAAECYPMDARLEEKVAEAVDDIERNVGPIEVAVFNIGANVKYDVTATTPRVFRKVRLHAGVIGLVFHAGREVYVLVNQNKNGRPLFTSHSDT